MNLEQIRKDTKGCENIIHLNNAGASLMPSVVAESIKNYLSREEMEGGYELADKLHNELNLFYDYAAQLIHAKSHNMAFTANATDSYNRALSSVAFKQGDVILTTENDYPSNFIAFISLEKRFGVKMVRIKNATTGEVDLDDFTDKLKTYHPKLVSVSHVPTSSGLVQPVEEIGELIKDTDSLFLLDACQSLGQLEVDAQKTHADFISGTMRKFLRGPRGAGLLYVSDKALEMGLEPLFPDIRGAEWVTPNSYEQKPTANRFEDWEFAYALMAGSREAIKYALGLGMTNIVARNRQLDKRLRDGLAQNTRVQLRDRGSKKCSIITFSINGISPDGFKEFFHKKGINVYATSKNSAVMDFAEKGVEWVARVSPHYYNTEEEIDVFLETLEQI